MTRDPFIPDQKDTKARVFPPAEGDRIVSARPDDTPRDHPWTDAAGNAWDLDSFTDACFECGGTPDSHPLRRSPRSGLAAVAAGGLSAMHVGVTDTPRDPLAAPESAEEAMDRALLYVFQRKGMNARAAVAMIRALAQDGYTLTLDATRPSGDEALRPYRENMQRLAVALDQQDRDFAAHGLSVKTLARVFSETTVLCHVSSSTARKGTMLPNTAKEFAEAIAREYAALATPSSTPDVDPVP